MQPPTSTTFETTSDSLQAQFDEAQKTLESLREQTTALAESVENDKTKINQVVEEVEECVRGFKGAEESQREEMRDFRGEIEALKALVPRVSDRNDRTDKQMIEKHTTSQTAALQDLQNELRSLKALLVSRQQTASSGSTGAASPVPQRTSIPAWQMSGGSSTPSWKTPASVGEKGKEKEAVAEDKVEGSEA